MASWPQVRQPDVFRCAKNDSSGRQPERQLTYHGAMIVGTGIDLCEVARMRNAVERFGDRFLARCFTDQERTDCLARRDPAPGLAARWAAKEATAKALGTGLGGRVGWLEVEVVRTDTGRPELRLTGSAAAEATRQGVRHLHLSLTHERGMAAAVVVAEG